MQIFFANNQGKIVIERQETHEFQGRNSTVIGNTKENILALKTMSSYCAERYVVMYQVGYTGNTTGHTTCIKYKASGQKKQGKLMRKVIFHFPLPFSICKLFHFNECQLNFEFKNDT